MTNDKWHSLSILDPFVRGIGKSAVSQYLKGLCNDQIVKIFVSGADGGKVGFNAKPNTGLTRECPNYGVSLEPPSAFSSGRCVTGTSGSR